MFSEPLATERRADGKIVHEKRFVTLGRRDQRHDFPSAKHAMYGVRRLLLVVVEHLTHWQELKALRRLHSLDCRHMLHGSLNCPRDVVRPRQFGLSTVSQHFGTQLVLDGVLTKPRSSQRTAQAPIVRAVVDRERRYGLRGRRLWLDVLSQVTATDGIYACL